MKALPEPSWEEWLPLLKKVVYLALTALVAYGARSVEVAAKGELDTTASNANQVVKIEQVLEGEYQTFYDYVRWHDQHEARCDSALEMFERHRDDEDFRQVWKACHSD